MMCDLENSYSDENGLPSDECLKALQNVDVKDCYLQDCPGTETRALQNNSSYAYLRQNSQFHPQASLSKCGLFPKAPRYKE